MAPSGAGGVAGDGGGIRAFLIADVRGYTLFTQTRGDEAAGKLAARFAEVAREGIEARGGRLLELRGDEALAVFDSPRQAIRAAVELQERFADETDANPELPLPVGIGLDAGEAVEVEGGYRGGALNLAARLCALAGPGEVLASREITHLARRTEGVRFLDRGAVHLKGITEPVDVVRVLPEEGEDPATRLAPFRPAPSPAAPEPARGRTGARALIAAGVAVAVIAGAVAFLLTRGGGRHTFASIAPNAVGIVDPNSGAITGVIPTEGRPGEIAVAGGVAWMTLPDAGKVVRVDVQRHSVTDSIEVGQEPYGITVGAGAVWVGNSGSGTVSRIDPQSDKVVQTIHVGNGPFGITIAGGSVWVSNRLDGSLDQIDPKSGHITRTIRTGPSPTNLAAGGGMLWLSTGDATVSRIALDTSTITASVHVGNGPSGLAVTPDSVWVANSLDGTVSQIDPARATVTATIPVGSGANAVAVSGPTVWVTNQFGSSLSRIDAASGSLGGTVEVGNQPVDLALEDGNLLVPVTGGSAAHRGGTLTAVGDYLDSIDPGSAYSAGAWQLLVLTNDGLVGYERVGGAEGSTLVPDLATSLPVPTDEGRSYTFQLRPGIHYSTGAAVRPEDIRRGIERFIQSGSARTQYFSEIVGATDCGKRSETCDLGQGIETDDATRTVTFHLTRPNPEFLDQLALPFADAVPAGVPPARLHTTSPLPATGPYMIDRYVPNQEVDLIRNPRFREWSAAAQPDGYPDRIVYRLNVPAQRSPAMVERGTADVLFGVPTSSVRELETRFGAQLHAHPQAITYYLVLNTEVPPFDDVRVRRAFNYAVDRRQIERLFGGAHQALSTCQLLPPNFPGYVRYCPYTPGPHSSSPDLEKARRLVDASGTKGTKVILWGTSDPGFAGAGAVPRYLTGVLRELGYDARVHLVGDLNKYFSGLNTPLGKPLPLQAAMSGWIADYVSAGSFIQSQLTCGERANLAHFCDPHIDAQVQAAYRLQQTNPVAASYRWVAIDRAITDAAPYVELVNPVGLDFVSKRVANYEHNPTWGVLLSQLWVK